MSLPESRPRSDRNPGRSTYQGVRRRSIDSSEDGMLGVAMKMLLWIVLIAVARMFPPCLGKTTDSAGEANPVVVRERSLSRVVVI